MKYAFIKAHSQEHKVARMVTALEVSPSGYYDWLNRPESPRGLANRSLITKITLFHQVSRCIYGAPRIHKDLVEHGEQVGVNRVARLMRIHDIQSRMARKFVITTDSKNTLDAAPDLLQRQFNVPCPDLAWVSDTTFIPTRQGWLYLAIVIDLYSRLVVGWSMGVNRPGFSGGFLS